MSYRIGLDIGIGSVGWAVIVGDSRDAYIDDFGVRIFDSGENEKTRASNAQERRGFRSVRRLERRKAFRKIMLSNHFDYIGLKDPTFNDELFDCKDLDVYALKVKGLDEKLSAAQLFKCLLHTANHRGYQSFYEDDAESKEEGVNKVAVNQFEEAFRESGTRTVSEFLLTTRKYGNSVKFRNVKGSGNEYLLISRELLKSEVRAILEKQKAYYPQLTEKNIQATVDIIFTQRDFEDGPGNSNDDSRRYKGFVAQLGQCPFYKNEKRGFRGSVISDVYAVVNTLSQYQFLNEETGELAGDKDCNAELIDFLLLNGNITMTQVKRILKSHSIRLIKSERSDDKALSKAVRFLSMAKKCIEEAGESWDEYISEEQFNPNRPSRLAKISEVLSSYQTPRRRRSEFNNLPFMKGKKALIQQLMGRKLSGTARTSNRYMCDAIDAFRRGEIYGCFQARKTEEVQVEQYEKSRKLFPWHIDDPEVKTNTVVFKAINETRKVVNAIIESYGTPDKIIVEVADELGRSFLERDEIKRTQNENEAKNDLVRTSIKSLLQLKDESDVSSDQIDRYKLYFQQEGKSPYSGKALGDLTDVLLNTNKIYEVDHIVPYSLILDNTLSNKALVFSRENQSKGQKTPLMYLTGADREQFVSFVKLMYTRDLERLSKKKDPTPYPPFSRKKYEYMMMETTDGADAEEKLNAWKSRNMNDTRYITKYICSIFNKYLAFEHEEKKNVFGINGRITDRFRRIWLAETDWADKDRDNYLNHAVDAIVIANLTPAYIEIASDSIKLQQLIRKYRRSPLSKEYNDYFEKCLSKMEKYYGFSRAYTSSLLRESDRVPSYVRDLKKEVIARCNSQDEDEFAYKLQKVYPNRSFIRPPHMPLASLKQERKFKGQIADSNPVRIVWINGAPHKIQRKNVIDIKENDLTSIRTNDKALLSDLKKVFEEKGSVKDCLKEQNTQVFTTSKGQPVRKVSIDGGVVSNFYRVEKAEDNHSNLSMLKYFCVEVYLDDQGRTNTRGIRYVDVERRNGKLLIKPEALPKDYAKHSCYLFKNDYIIVFTKNREVKYKGFFTAVKNINQNEFNLKENNNAKPSRIFLTRNDTIEKYSIDILGKLGGKIQCSEPLSLTTESNSR